MEQALRIQHADLDAPPAERPRTWIEESSSPEAIEKVLRFTTPSKSAEAGAAQRGTGVVTARDFAAAIEGVHEAAQLIRAADERTREAEARTHSVAQRAAEELKLAEGRIQALEGRIRTAEARAQDAEARAKEADAWLRQIFSTISEELPVRKPA